MLIQISTVSMLAAQKTHFQQKKELHRLSETPLLILLDSIYSKSHSGVKYAPHTILLRNNMRPESEHKSGLWDLSIFWKESYAENLKKIVGAV